LVSWLLIMIAAVSNHPLSHEGHTGRTYARRTELWCPVRMRSCASILYCCLPVAKNIMDAPKKMWWCRSLECRTCAHLSR
jgi:hypothetical protein